MRKIINSEAVFLGFITAVLICVFYDRQVLTTLSALAHILSYLF